MPLPKPRKDEEQSDFMKRCMSEAFGDDAPKDRTQEQAVAMCMQAWRDKDKALPKVKQDISDVDLPDPDDDEGFEDYIDRCTDEVMDASENDDLDEDDVRDACEANWGDYWSSRSAKPKQPVFHKTHVGTNIGMEFVLSDDTPDRMGDVISVTGWELANFKKNPVALFNHNPNFPIGKWHDLKVEGNKLKGRLVPAPEGTSDRIDEIRRLIDAGILQAVSVGFRPIDSKPRESKGAFLGEHFLKQELIECSLVAVPANANALAVAKSLNVSPATLGFVFRQARQKEDPVKRRDLPLTAKHGGASKPQDGRSSAMSLSQRISDVQNQIANKQADLEAHLSNQDDSNVSDTDLEKTTLLNAQIGQLQKQHDALIEAEKRIGANLKANGDAASHQIHHQGNGRSIIPIDQRGGIGAPIIMKHSKKDWTPLDLLVHAGVITAAAKIWKMPPDQVRLKIYGDDEPTKVMFDWTQRAPSAPAMTTVTGWAAELVQQIYTDMMALLMPKSVFPRLAAKGLTLSFGRAGRIVLPTRSRTPSLAGSFVGEGMAIPVRQGAFTAQTFIPKKMAVITTWTKEMEDHSIPAIEGVLREAIQEDTAVAIDSVLLDSNPATTIRPAGLLNGVAGSTPTAGGGLPAIIGDIKTLVSALTTTSFGNIRSPAWLMNPADMLSASLVSAANTGIFPFKDEIGRGTLGNIPIIDSSTVPAKTVILVDAADFVVMQSDAVRFDISDQATLHMEDTMPLDLVSGSPGTVAAPQRSLFQTDSLALRMVMPLNWANRRAGTVAYVTGITW